MNRFESGGPAHYRRQLSGSGVLLSSVPALGLPRVVLALKGWCEARALARALPADALLLASREPKARQTLEQAGSVYTDKRFNEVTRDEPYEGDFQARRRAYVTGTDHTGWEPRDQVVARFAEGVRFWTARADGRPLVIASHGMAMTLWLTTTVALADPGAFWADLRLPGLLTVDVTGKQVFRPESDDPSGVS
ncbi:histidine phosphatase family protein [Actinoplanes flavus]|uniref:Histidine phosphatase family protein n=1 Tax=Actinoplanes flavus TaxID=2820290 RepID=A0ABS3UNE9_9ACTN|nr:histidine phosphatase family protein [Actinoplanes flavus]MBO3739187.1 histidine phosphatase family protein [Actinoplanes flavus]